LGDHALKVDVIDFLREGGHIGKDVQCEFHKFSNIYVRSYETTGGLHESSSDDLGSVFQKQ